MSAIDLNSLLDYLDELNSTADSSSCNDSDCFSLETLACPRTLNKTALLHTISYFYIFIFVIGLLANSVVVWVNLRTKRNHFETHLYVLNLAVADLCVVITLPIWVASLVNHGQWHMGGFMCKITHLIFSVNLFGSIFFLTCMSVDRYVSVTLFRDSNNRNKRIIRRLICIFMWLFAFGASIPDTYFLQIIAEPFTNDVYCRVTYPLEYFWEWLVGMELLCIVLGFVIPFPIIAIFYILLASAITASSDQERKTSRKIIFSYVIVFLVCWLPYHTVLLIEALTMLQVLPFSCDLEDFLYVAIHVTQCFSLIHCCINPILYNFINRNYRYDLMKAFIFKYSTKTGLTKLIDASKVSETEYSMVEPSGV
ncbi:atypical chemokine receptor 3b [Latimeria chalumnae]|uniref:Atypical chemokine receptor 3 n=1 Tax=Latimeria chalumnae TaxID=7897 RepID=H3B8H5_LATCH|nr:PREDICTED: atypical chemokine receptor 3 [Latimeria chalumnae]|eukprot:XP_005997465.1 PREDICTED: atypical chemokine receptor 3 [Latimeria chalumnae]